MKQRLIASVFAAALFGAGFPGVAAEAAKSSGSRSRKRERSPRTDEGLPPRGTCDSVPARTSGALVHPVPGAPNIAVKQPARELRNLPKGRCAKAIAVSFGSCSA